MKSKIDKLVAGEIDVINAVMPLGRLSTMVELGEMETNGWQVDYWVDGIYKDKKLSISGSMYYGNMTIERKE